MKITFSIVIEALFATALCAAPIKSLEDGFKSPWTELKIAFAVDPGCTGIETPEELIISRQGDQMTIFKKKTTQTGEITYSSPHPLSKKDFDQIVLKLAKFYQQAKSETDIAEYFDSLPKDEKEKELEDYFKAHGRPIGGFGGKYFFVQFQPYTLDSIVINAFKEPKSYNAFIEWIRTTSDYYSTKR